MLFSSMIFLWGMLPLSLLIYYLAPQKARNYILLIVSLIIYAWGEPYYILLLLTSIVVNYLLAILIDKVKLENQQSKAKAILVLDVVFNIGLLFYFKYFDTCCYYINKVAGKDLLGIRGIILPLGISFYTFQIMSYVIDLYRGNTKCQKNLAYFALYVSLFPQLVAGPIVKYKDVEDQIYSRSYSAEGFAYGIKRFIYGLSKKVLISNALGSVVDSIYLNYTNEEAGSFILWIASFAYTLQLYYDFSGYSDMAIGLGKMYGFDFAENFDYPYISKSIREFWRRWHISLSTWFREYVYIPLGGNRKGIKRTYINLAIVFILTGVWHGSTLNFLFWGMWHGIFMLIERAFLGNALDKCKFKLVNYIYTLFIVVVGWTLFYCSSLGEAAGRLAMMFSFKPSALGVGFMDIMNAQTIIISVIGILLCGPVQTAIKGMKDKLFDKNRFYVPELVLQTVLFFMCIMSLAADTYNPFIYFRF